MEARFGCTSDAADNGQDPMTEEESSQNGKRRVKRWTESEHEMLVRLAESLGEDACWATIAEHIPGRTGKQCRERWVNHIGSNIKKGGWTVEEEKQMARLHATIGPSWTRIANELGGRTENSVKNHYNALLRSKRLDDKKTSVLAQYIRLVRNKLASGMAAYEQAIELAQNAALEASMSGNTSNPSSRSRSSKKGTSQQASHGEVKNKQSGTPQVSRQQASGSVGVPSYSSPSVGPGGGTTAMSGHTIGDATAALAAAVAAVQAAAHAVAGVTGVSNTSSRPLGYRNSVDPAASEGVVNSVQLSAGSPHAAPSAAQSSLSGSLHSNPSGNLADEAMRGKGVNLRRTGRGGRGRPGFGHMPSIRDAKDGLMAARARAQSASSGDGPALVRHLSESHVNAGESSHPMLRPHMSMGVPTVQGPSGEVYGATPETASKLSTVLQEQVAQLAGILKAPGMPLCPPPGDGAADTGAPDNRGLLTQDSTQGGSRVVMQAADAFQPQPDSIQAATAAAIMQQPGMLPPQEPAGASAGSLTLGMQDLGHGGYTSVFNVQHPAVAEHNTVFGRQQGVELGSPMSPGPRQAVSNPLNSMFSQLPTRPSFDLFQAVQEPQDQPLLGRLSGLSLDVMLASPLSAHTPPASALYFLQGNMRGREGQYGPGMHLSPFSRDSIGLDMAQRNSVAMNQGMRAATVDELGLQPLRPLSVKTRKGGVTLGGGVYESGSPGLGGDDTPASKMTTSHQLSYVPPGLLDGTTPTASMLGEVFLTWTQEPTTPGSVLINTTMSNGGGMQGTYPGLTADGQAYPKYMPFRQGGYSNAGAADRCLYADSELPPVDVPPPEVMGCLDIIFDDDPLEELPMPHPGMPGSGMVQGVMQQEDPGHSLGGGLDAAGGGTPLAAHLQDHAVSYAAQHSPVALYGGAHQAMPVAQEQMQPNWGTPTAPTSNKRTSTQIWGDAYSPGHSHAKRTASGVFAGVPDVYTPTYVPSSLGPVNTGYAVGGGGVSVGGGVGGYSPQTPTGPLAKPSNVAQRRMVTWGPPHDMGGARCASEPGAPQYSNESSGTPQHAQALRQQLPLRRAGAPAGALASQRRAARKRSNDRFPGVYHLPPVPVEPSKQAASDAQTDCVPRLLPGFADMSLTRVALERLYHSPQNQQHEPEDVLSSLPNVWLVGAPTDEKPQRAKNQQRSPDYFANVGDAIRTLREDIPDLFNRELNYSIYRDDIVFKDPRNTFEGIKNYKLIFWSLRFHGKIFFTKLYVEVKRIWQPTDDSIKMRWTVHGVPRVPWEAEGIFDGISTYKLDSNGRVYEHSVDNVLLRDPPVLTNPPLLAGLNLVPGAPQQQPCPGAWGTAITSADSSLLPAPTSLTTSQPAITRSQSLPAQATNPPPGLHRSHSWPMLTPTITAAAAQPEVQQQSVQVQHSSSTDSKSVWARFSWIRLYAAAWASLWLLGAMTQAPSGELKAADLEPSPS